MLDKWLDEYDVDHLDLMRLMAGGLALFFAFVGIYLILENKDNGDWMLVGSAASALAAWVLHKAYKRKFDQKTIRKKLGY